MSKGISKDKLPIRKGSRSFLRTNIRNMSGSIKESVFELVNLHL